VGVVEWAWCFSQYCNMVGGWLVVILNITQFIHSLGVNKLPKEFVPLFAVNC